MMLTRATLVACILTLTLYISSSYAFDGDEVDGTGCPKAFRGKCHCKKMSYYYWKPERESFVVNCTNTGFNDTSMLEQLPDGIEILIFNGNNVPVLDWNVLGMWDDHKQLAVVDMTNNGIREIAGKSFHKVSTVKRLVLSHNDLMISGPNLHTRIFSNFYSLEELHLTNAFTETIDSKWYLSDLKSIFMASNMTKLRKLHLEQNEIWSIKDEDMFCPLKSLEDLYLGDNQLQGVEFDFSCLKQLRHLDLQYNKIRRFPSKTLRKFDQVFGAGSSQPGAKQLSLKGNSFRCDCHLKNFAQWLNRTKTQFYHKEAIRCYDGYPESNAGKRVLNVDRFECQKPSKTTGGADSDFASAEGSTTTHALLVILILLVIAVGCLVVYYNRIKLHEKVKPLVVSFQKSMQYRTIGKEEEPQEVNV